MLLTQEEFVTEIEALDIEPEDLAAEETWAEFEASHSEDLAWLGMLGDAYSRRHGDDY